MRFHAVPLLMSHGLLNAANQIEMLFFAGNATCSFYSLLKIVILTVMTDTGYTSPSSANCGAFWIRPIAMMATSGKFRRGEPNLPPIAPMLLNVIVPPDISSGLSLLVKANCCNRDSSFVIWSNHKQALALKQWLLVACWYGSY